MVHWKARKQALQYLKGSQDYGLIYNTPNSTSGLQIYADADGMSLNNRKVVSGYAFILNGTAVSWLSKQQEIVSLSTTEAEYIVLTYAAKETIWFCNFLSKLISPITFLFSIYNNNQSAISLAHAELGQFHARTKHINIQYYFIHEKSEMACLTSLIVSPTRWLLTSSQSPCPPTSLNPLFVYWD